MHELKEMEKPMSSLDESGMAESCTCKLSAILSSLIAFQFFLKSSHWQCQGSRFYEFHTMFDQLYESLEDVIDELAELAVREGKTIHYDIGKISETSLVRVPLDYSQEELITATYYMACDISNLVEQPGENRSQNAVLDNIALVISKIKYITGSAITI